MQALTIFVGSLFIGNYVTMALCRRDCNAQAQCNAELMLLIENPSNVGPAGYHRTSCLEYLESFLGNEG